MVEGSVEHTHAGKNVRLRSMLLGDDSIWRWNGRVSEAANSELEKKEIGTQELTVGLTQLKR